MNSLFRSTKHFLQYFGFDPRTFVHNVGGLTWFTKDLLALRKQLKGNPDFPLGKMYPVLTDKFAPSGNLTDHYFFQDLFVANRIFKNNPKRHVDIASRIDGFVAHVASFREIEVFDIRPIKKDIQNIIFIQTDFTTLNPALVDYTDSLSCLHALEHFGLGRYGDKLDVDGHLKGLDSFYATLKKGGKFYFSTPIGPQRIEFNAHRVFTMKYLLNLFEKKYRIDAFSYISDNNVLFPNVVLTEEQIQNNFGCNFGCGIFELTKI